MSVYKFEHDDKSFGDFNDAPEGWRELTEEQFAKSHFWISNPTHYEFRQICRWSDGTPWDGPMVSVNLFHMRDKTGYGMSSSHWAGKIRYFQFGCDHDYKGLSQAECRKRDIYHAGHCYHVSECKKCGNVNSVDSSG